MPGQPEAVGDSYGEERGHNDPLCPAVAPIAIQAAVSTCSNSNKQQLVVALQSSSL